MAISVEGQYYLTISVAGKKDFIGETDLKEFTIIEKAGNTLPSFFLEFTSHEEELISILNDGNDITVQLGKTKDTLLDILITPTDLKSYRTSETEFSFTVTGLLAHLPYANAARAKCTEKKSGVAVMSDIAKEYGFKFEGNIETSKDSQNWVQYGIPSKLFLDEVWLHSYVNDSFVGMGISVDSRMIVKDMKKEIKAKNDAPDWRLVKVKSKENDITFLNNYIIENNSGLINSWVGSGRERMIYNLPAATFEKYSATPSPIIALSKETALNKDMGKKFSGSNILSGNQDDNFWKAHQENLTNLALLSSFKITVPCGNEFFPIKPLDVVFFKDMSVTNGLESNEYISGLYFTAKVVRTLKERVLSTYVEICRESPNLVRNNAS